MTDEQINWRHRASIALDSAITRRHLITYNDLADAARVPAPHRIHKLTMWLETLIYEDHKSAKPLRAAWVVSRQRGKLPAPGFFLKCSEIGVYNGPVNGPKAAEFHQKLLAHHPG